MRSDNDFQSISQTVCTELYQIYDLGAVGEKDELIRLEQSHARRPKYGKRSLVYRCIFQVCGVMSR